MAIHMRFIAAFLLLVNAFSATTAADVAAVGGAVHDMLPEYGLPRGILPDSVKSYSLSGDGEFEVELKAPCYVQFSDLVYYDRRIKGKVSYGAISDLSGIQVKKLFVWVPITGIVAHPGDGTVEFKVGFLSESLPVSQFNDIPICKAKATCRGATGFLPEAIPLSEV